MKNKFKLTKKSKLTHNVYELVFECEKELQFVAGQFLTFFLPKTGFARAYSVAKTEDNKNFEFIIKRLDDGRGGSKEICDMELGTQVDGFGPTGHFVLKNNDKNKMFIGTGTGFAPLYCQVLAEISKGSKLLFLFGVQYTKDVFYLDILEDLKNKYNNFDYKIYLSREELNNDELGIMNCEFKNFDTGYVSKYIDDNGIGDFGEFYICGNPGVVTSVEEKLLDLGIKNDNIFYEKY